MRKKFLFIVILLLAFTNLFAQFNAGVFGGLNSGTFKGDQPKDAEYSNLISPDFGIVLDLALTNQITLSFQPGLTKRGTKISYYVRKKVEPVDSISIKVDYFSIPLLIKISSKNKRFYAIGGLDAGIPLSATAMFISIPEDKRDIEKYMSKVNVVMHFGFGYRIPVGKTTLFAEARYLQGLNNAVPVEKPENYFFPRVRTSDMQLLFGVEFPLF